MKKIIQIALPAFSAIIVTVIILLYYGIIWFNNPSRSEFPVQGIDISNHQGKIDWAKLKNSGIDFVYIKATEGGDFKDKSFIYNYEQARNYGILAGAYHFFTLCKSGKLQAANFISAVPRNSQLPPAIDLEFTGNCRDADSMIDFDTEFKIFYNLISEYYSQIPVIYTTYEFYNKYDISQYMTRLWIRDIFFRPSSQYRWKFWQYTSRLKLEGVEGYIDGNVFSGSRKDFNDFIKQAASD